jgi:hypothetical protein
MMGRDNEMTDTAQLSRTVVDNVLDAVRQTQEFAINNVNQWTDTARKFNSDLPTKNLNNPFAEYFPRPAELVDSYFDFAERLLANQREFALNLTKGLNAKVVSTDEPKAARSTRTAVVAG